MTTLWKSLALSTTLALALLITPVFAEEKPAKTTPKAKAKTEAPANQQEPAHGKQKFLHFGNMGGLLPTLTKTDLPEADSEAAQWVVKYCTECHNTPGPGLHIAKEWDTLIWRMYWRMVVMDANFKDFVVPSWGELQSILNYMKQFALRPISSTAVDRGKPGAVEFLTICGQCHTYPDPSQYPKQDWDATVKRMKRHMGTMNRTIPDAMNTESILTFLKSTPTP